MIRHLLGASCRCSSAPTTMTRIGLFKLGCGKNVRVGVSGIRREAYGPATRHGATMAVERQEDEMDLQLNGRTALVTGASMGIGRGIALALAAEGVKLAVVARRKALLDELADEIVAAKGLRPTVIVADIMAADAASSISEQALGALGHVDILINNAGGSRKLPVDAPEASWEEAMTLNFTRVRQLTHALLPTMMARKWGRIVNISG